MTNYTELYMWGPLGCLSTSENTSTPTEDAVCRTVAPTEVAEIIVTPKKAKRNRIPDQLFEMSASWLCFNNIDVPPPSIPLSKVTSHRDGVVSVKMFDDIGPIGTIKWAADRTPCHAPANGVDWDEVKDIKPERKFVNWCHGKYGEARRAAKAKAKREARARAEAEKAPAVPQEPYQPTAGQVEQKPEAMDAYQKGALRNKLIGLACAQYKSDGKEMSWVKYKVVLRKTGVATITITCRRSGEKLATYQWTEAGGLVEWTPRNAKKAKTMPEVVTEPQPQPTYQAVPTPHWQPTAEQLSNRYPMALIPRSRPPQQPVIEDVGTTPAASNIVEFRPRHIIEPTA